MVEIERISLEDQRQMPVIGQIKFHWNTEGELIFLSYVYAGRTYRQAVTDTDYAGGILWADISRTKVFEELVRQ